jgi:hypothetical protein
MVCARVILTAILAGVIAACGANGVASPALVATPADVAAATTPTPISTPITSPVPTTSKQSLSTSPTPPSAKSPTPSPEPVKPTGVKFDMHAVEHDGGLADITQTVTWRTPRATGVEIRVNGVTKCIGMPANPSPGTSGSCLVTGTPLPGSVRTLLGTAPASKGVVSWSWTEESGCDIGLASDPGGPQYYSVVVAAYNATGHSIFAIAEPGGWWEPGPTDVIC